MCPIFFKMTFTAKIAWTKLLKFDCTHLFWFNSGSVANVTSFCSKSALFQHLQIYQPVLHNYPISNNLFSKSIIISCINIRIVNIRYFCLIIRIFDWLGILFSTAVIATVAGEPVICHILPSMLLIFTF